MEMMVAAIDSRDAISNDAGNVCSISDYNSDSGGSVSSHGSGRLVIVE